MKVVRKKGVIPKQKKGVKAGVKTKYSFQLVKWEGDAPPNWRDIKDPQNHPQCAEVLEWQLGQPHQTKYKKE